MQSDPPRSSRYFHLFPAVELANTTEEIMGVVLKNWSLADTESAENATRLKSLFALFQDRFGENIQCGIYILDEPSWEVREIWALLRFAGHIPRWYSDSDTELVEWYEFMTTEEWLVKYGGFLSVDLNGKAIWSRLGHHDFIKYIQCLSNSGKLSISTEDIYLSKRVGSLFVASKKAEASTTKLAERLKRAIYWYNSSHNDNSQQIERAVLDMGIAFEALFQTPNEHVAEYLETALSVIFPDNDFIPKWLKQFYKARSTIAHGSSPSFKDLQLNLDRSEHYSLVYWAQRIFRACIEANVIQWEIAEKSGLLKAMTPNRTRLQRILGKLQEESIDDLVRSFPAGVATDIETLHINEYDYPDESLNQTASIGEIIAKVFVRSAIATDSDVIDLLNKLLELPKDWDKDGKYREEAAELYDAVIGKYGDADSLSPVRTLQFKSAIDQVLYQWAKFAYMHIVTFELMIGETVARPATSLSFRPKDKHSK